MAQFQPLRTSAIACNRADLLEGRDVERAISAVRGIAIALADLPSASRLANGSLAGGACGRALFFEYLSRSGILPEFDGEAERCVDEALAWLEVAAVTPTLFGGLTGVGWAVSHLRATGAHYAQGIDTQVVREAIDTLLANVTADESYDLIGGLVGLLVATLEDSQDPYDTRRRVGLIADHLVAQAVRTRTGLTWRTMADTLPAAVRHFYPAAHFNLGVAHGVPGVLVALAAASRVGHEASREAADAAATWLIRAARNSADGRFVHWIPEDGSPTGNSRAAWCYGDPGVATTFAVAGAYCARPDFVEFGRRLAIEASYRSRDSSDVADAGLCHGSSGLAHIYSRWFQATGDERFLHAARSWYRTTLDFRNPSGGIGGFSALRAGKAYDEPGFLSGAAGVGLSLLAALGGTAPDWDRVLLVSPQPFVMAAVRADNLQ